MKMKEQVRPTACYPYSCCSSCHNSWDLQWTVCHLDRQFQVGALSNWQLTFAYAPFADQWIWRAVWYSLLNLDISLCCLMENRDLHFSLGVSWWTREPKHLLGSWVAVANPIIGGRFALESVGRDQPNARPWLQWHWCTLPQQPVNNAYRIIDIIYEKASSIVILCDKPFYYTVYVNPWPLKGSCLAHLKAKQACSSLRSCPRTNVSKPEFSVTSVTWLQRFGDTGGFAASFLEGTKWLFIVQAPHPPNEERG